MPSEQRLPPIGNLRPANRQQLRRLADHEAKCWRCGQKMLSGQAIVLDDGHDAHAECSLARNAELRSLARVFAAQDARDKGTTPPCQPVTKLQRLQPLERRRGS